jgi:hypothetical protein
MKRGAQQGGKANTMQHNSEVTTIQIFVNMGNNLMGDLFFNSKTFIYLGFVIRRLHTTAKVGSSGGLASLSLSIVPYQLFLSRPPTLQQHPTPAYNI